MLRTSVGSTAAAAGLGLIGLMIFASGSAHAAAGAPGAPPPGATAPAPGAGSFEGFLNAAEPAPKAEALVAPFADDCAQLRRELDRARCRGTQAFLRARLPGKTLHAVVDSARVVSVSAYDAGVRGYRVRLLGCVTCDDPVVDAQGEARYVTLAVPAKSAPSLREAVVVAETTVQFDNPEAGRAWEGRVRPHLRAEFLFRGDGTAWSHGGRKGVAFSPLAMRIFDRCTGQVIWSQPASDKPVPVADDLPGCAPPATVARAAAPASSGRNKEGIAELPEKLVGTDITAALHERRAAMAACDAAYKRPGSVDLEFDVDGESGRTEAVRAKGGLNGTPVAQCLLDAVSGARFPRFQKSRQTFTYPVRLGAVQR